ncbi:MAG: hypothetical protein K0B87_06510 [Candidatus Syntrophosphaera sp.]|nr:hypothetical protein [Candidatus Syntrophosphaera sp.]
MTHTQGNRLSIAVSLLVHAAILAVMALAMIEPVSVQRWYELDFRDPLALIEEEAFAEQSGGPESQIRADNLPGRPRETLFPGQKQQDQASANITSQEYAPGQSELLETPFLADESNRSGRVDLGPNPAAQSALRQVIGGDGADGGSVSFRVTGGRVRFTLPAGYKHNLGASGSVTLQFKVDRYARPVSNTIVPIQQTEPRFFEAAKQVLLDGKFTFDGAPEPGVTCRITFEFL